MANPPQKGPPPLPPGARPSQPAVQNRPPAAQPPRPDPSTAQTLVNHPVAPVKAPAASPARPAAPAAAAPAPVRSAVQGTAAATRPAAAQPPKPAALGATPNAPSGEAAAVRREKQRVKMQATIDFGSENNFYNGFSTNISEGGVFVATVKLVPLGTEVDLSFSLPTGEKIECRGVVRWIREINDRQPESMPGIGIEFVGLAAPAQEAVARFVANRDPMFYVE